MTNSKADPTADGNGFWRRHALAPTAAFLVLAPAFELSSLDVSLADCFYDRATGRWRWADAWWSNELIHTGGKDLVLLLGLGALGCWAASFFVPRLRPLRRAGAFLALSIALGTGLVAVLKNTTNVDCPWDMDLYGGNRPFVTLFEDRPGGLEPGRCFPGGHSSGAFSLCGFYFLFHRRDRRVSLAALGTSLALGLVFSFGQWVRGAHFASHDLWSAFLCWFVSLLLYAWVFRFHI